MHTSVEPVVGVAVAVAVVEAVEVVAVAVGAGEAAAVVGVADGVAVAAVPWPEEAAACVVADAACRGV